MKGKILERQFPFFSWNYSNLFFFASIFMTVAKTQCPNKEKGHMEHLKIGESF